MGCLSLLFGILSIIGMVVGFLPLLGWLNWINIPFAGVGLALGVIGVIINSNNSRAVAGIVMCAVAIGIGGFRLVLGLGVF